MSSVNTASYRAPNGRFSSGNRIASGNPNAKRLYELRKALLDSTSVERIKAVANKLGDLAEAGDVQAAKLYLEFVVGKPAQALEISGLDGEPLGVSVHQLRTVILAAVGDDPNGRVKVARALRALVRSGQADDEPAAEEGADHPAVALAAGETT